MRILGCDTCHNQMTLSEDEENNLRGWKVETISEVGFDRSVVTCLECRLSKLEGALK